MSLARHRKSSSTGRDFHGNAQAPCIHTAIMPSVLLAGTLDRLTSQSILHVIQPEAWPAIGCHEHSLYCCMNHLRNVHLLSHLKILAYYKVTHQCLFSSERIRMPPSLPPTASGCCAEYRKRSSHGGGINLTHVRHTRHTIPLLG